MQTQEILALIRQHYSFPVVDVEFLRDSGCESYRVKGEGQDYFLRLSKPAMNPLAEQSLSVHLYLQACGFPVPPILLTCSGDYSLHVFDGDQERILVLYEYLQGEEADPERDMESIGNLVARLHNLMDAYPGEVKHLDRSYYIDRYLHIMEQKGYAGRDAFAAFGETLWDRVKDLPRGICHGDLYCGNLLKTEDGTIYLLDMDTFACGIRLYDAALICNATDFFRLKDEDHGRTMALFARFLRSYCMQRPVSPAEQATLGDVIALYHFALQATIIELFGLDCVDDRFLDRQMAWLMHWKTLCDNKKA